MEHTHQKMWPSLASIHALILILTIAGAASRVAGQVGTGKTVIQKATEQFDNSPLTTISLGPGLFVFSGDGGNVTAVVDSGSTLLIDSGMDSRATELNDAVFKATMRPVTRLVNTHWHFDHTGGNVFLGSSGVTIIAQENLKKQLSSVQDVPFIGLHDGHYPAEALPTVTYSSSMMLRQGSQQVTLGQLRTCTHGWRHSRLYRSGEYRSSRRHFLESRLPHYRSGVGRIHRWHDSFARSHSGAD